LFEAFANLVVYQALGLDPASHLGAAAHFFVMDVAKIFVPLVILIYVMGLLRALLSPERVREFVRGRPDWQARGFAVTLGAVTPFCSCSSVPLFIGFVEAGIPLGVTFSFLIASPMINEVAAVVLVGILGWGLAALHVGAGLLVAWFGGMAMQAFKPERWVEDYVWKIQMGEANLPEPDQSFAGRHRYAVAEVQEIVGRIWKWVLVGIGVGALFHGFVPEQWVSDNLGGDAWYTVPAAVLMGIPLYSNATGVIPVAEAMLTKGVTVGTTLALMMSVAALSLIVTSPPVLPRGSKRIPNPVPATSLPSGSRKRSGRPCRSRHPTPSRPREVWSARRPWPTASALWAAIARWRSATPSPTTQG
jgi:uncharacterized membrane protein YraQ (UPF0718 family)